MHLIIKTKETGARHREARPEAREPDAPTPPPPRAASSRRLAPAGRTGGRETTRERLLERATTRHNTHRSLRPVRPLALGRAVPRWAPQNFCTRRTLILGAP